MRKTYSKPGVALKSGPSSRRKNHSLPMEGSMELSRVLNALADPVRLKIVYTLSKCGEVACGQFDIEMPKSSLSHHFRVLRDAEIIGTRQEGTSTINFLLAKEMEERFPGLLESVLRSFGLQ